MEDIRSQFPILNAKLKSKQLVYFDNAASTQKPQSVIDALNFYYTSQNSNIHRGAHYLANLATEAYETTRQKIAHFIGANPKEIIFTSGTTHSINLLMQSWARKFLREGDEIVLTEMDHHANIVPWLYLQNLIGFKIQYIPMNADCTLELDQLDTIINTKTKLVSLGYVSNAMGTVHPIRDIIRMAKSKNAKIHIDAAQAIQHFDLDVRELGIDFMSFSSHKVYGPMGVGVFWAKEEHLHAMDPFFYGGEMIKEVYLDRFTVNEIPFKFEAGTPNVGDVIGLGAAIDYLNALGMKKIGELETELHRYFYTKIAEIEDLILYTPISSTSVISFNVRDVHAYDLGQLLDAQGIAVRTGHHCCQPLMRKLGIEGTCRASLAFYNTREEIDFFIVQLKKIIQLLK